MVDKNDLPFLTLSRELLSTDIEATAYKDKVFIMATPQWSRDGKTLMLDIDDKTPAVVGNNDLVKDIRSLGGNALSVPEVRSGQYMGDSWLISAGTLLSIDRHERVDGVAKRELITFRRTRVDGSGKIIAWPEAINNPMGRCEGLPSEVMLKEGCEEIGLYGVSLDPSSAFNQVAHGAARSLYWTFNGVAGIAPEKEIELAKSAEVYMAKNGLALPGSPILYPPLAIPAYADDRFAASNVQIVTRINGRVADEVRGVAISSPQEKTIETAMPLVVPEPMGVRLVAIAREPFGRPVTLMTDRELRAEHEGWLNGSRGIVTDPQQGKEVHLGGLLPVLQSAILGVRIAVSNPKLVP